MLSHTYVRNSMKEFFSCKISALMREVKVKGKVSTIELATVCATVFLPLWGQVPVELEVFHKCRTSATIWSRERSRMGHHLLHFDAC